MTLTELEMSGEYDQMYAILYKHGIALEKGNYRAVVLHTNQDKQLIINLDKNGAIVYYSGVSLVVFTKAMDLEAFINAVTSK